MKYFFLPCLVILIVVAGLPLPQSRRTGSTEINSIKKENLITCYPDRETMRKIIEDADIPPMPGAGKYQWNIRIKNDSARFYFNQGINMYYGFHVIESLGSFKKAVKFEDTNAMLWWAQALAYGPNINDVVYAVLPEALESVRWALRLSQNITPVEKLLIEAMAIRYSGDSTQSRQKLNHDYTMAMENIYLKYPANADVAALYVDAMMLEHPWELWNVNGTPKPWTPRIRDVLEKTLVKTPSHPGINHYYIHVMEPSPFPEKALASANRLGKLSPGLAHLVHMPSHIYLRTGYYGKGYTVNEAAVKQYNRYLALYPATAANEPLYRLHSEHMLVNCSMMAGRKEYSVKAALGLQKSMDTSYLSLPGGMGNYMQYVYMVPVLAMIRFEDWDGLLTSPAIDDRHIYARLLWHFGRGMAFSGKNNIPEAKVELALVERLLKDSSLYQPYDPFSPAIDGASTAAHLLKGTIALREKNNKEAIAFLVQAVEKEKSMVYNEPRDWLLNPKYFLAAAYNSDSKWFEAEKIFKQDLKDNNENVWSLGGLYKSLEKQGKKSEASKVLARLNKAAAGSDLSFKSGL